MISHYCCCYNFVSINIIIIIRIITIIVICQKLYLIRLSELCYLNSGFDRFWKCLNENDKYFSCTYLGWFSSIRIVDFCRLYMSCIYKLMLTLAALGSFICKATSAGAWGRKSPSGVQERMLKQFADTVYRFWPQKRPTFENFTQFACRLLTSMFHVGEAKRHYGPCLAPQLIIKMYNIMYTAASLRWPCLRYSAHSYLGHEADGEHRRKQGVDDQDDSPRAHHLHPLSYHPLHQWVQLRLTLMQP